MVTGQWILLGYAVLMLFGGLMGFRAGSKVSLYAGGGSALMLIVALAISFKSLWAGLLVGSVIALALFLQFAVRLKKTGKFMPAGMLMIVSLLAAALLGYTVWGMN